MRDSFCSIPLPNVVGAGSAAGSQKDSGSCPSGVDPRAVEQGPSTHVRPIEGCHAGWLCLCLSLPVALQTLKQCKLLSRPSRAVALKNAWCPSLDRHQMMMAGALRACLARCRHCWSHFPTIASSLLHVVSKTFSDHLVGALSLSSPLSRPLSSHSSSFEFCC